VSAPLIGQRYRGVEGRTGFLLRQAWFELRAAMEDVLRAHGLTPPQYGALTVLARDAPMSGADLARVNSTSAQAMNGVISTLERAGLIERHAHPTHGRILEISLTDEGRRRVEAADPAVRALEAELDSGLTPEQAGAIKDWLVAAAQRVASRA
jgi:DNA-binding MarR family transcriptional regulator